MGNFINEEHSAVRVLENLITKAIKNRVSDIHLEPKESAIRVRFRIDGILYHDSILELEIGGQVLSRIKVLAHLDVSEKRIPQDGKFLFSYTNISEIIYNLDLRVSTFPTTLGEKIVIRLLNVEQVNLILENLGFEPEMLDKIKTIVKSCGGFFLVTGPTGSGKTTTLHAMLKAVNCIEKNVCTLEDPVEYHINEITQGQVYPDIGFGFETGIRALLRQDPDIIMVGEIRDKETAKVAIKSALTGHFVLSTLHTNDAPGALVRLLDMDIEHYLINSALTGILAQRLVRKLCENCKFKRILTHSELSLNNIKSLKYIYEANGCENCSGTGYKGRIGIFQLLLTTDKLKALVCESPSLDKIYLQALVDGMESLMDDAVKKLAQGVTSLREILRVL